MTATLTRPALELWPANVTPAGPAPCRYCTAVAYLVDAEGPLHVCCRSNAARFAAGLGCPACYSAERLRNRDTDVTVLDRRAVLTGRRRSSPAEYRQAQGGAR